MIWQVEDVTSIDSTNSWLVEQARAGAPEGRAILAGFQRAGRGRLDRSWEAPADSALLLSLLLRPPTLRGASWAVSTVALSVRAALVRLSGVRPQLKWPNDLVVDDEKLGGLLAELVTDVPPAVVVGVGVNLTEYPPGLAATSVRQRAGVTLWPRALADIVFEEVEGRRGLLDDEEGLATLRDEYRGASATIGRRVLVTLLEDIVVGDAVDLDDDGALVVDVGGERRVFSAADVVHLRAQDRAGDS